MPEEELFQMTVVTTKRRPRGEGAEASEAEAQSQARHREHSSHHDGEHRSHHDGEHRSHHDGAHRSHAGETHPGSAAGSGAARPHHRRYNDYGSLTLGELGESPAAEEDDAPAQGEPTRGAIQREFYDKYDPVLSRRYSTRNKGKVSRILMVAALISLILLLVFFGIGSLGKQGEEKLPKPSVETIPVVTLDLG